jgi:hypothetical protein
MAKQTSNIIWVQGNRPDGRVVLSERDDNHPAYGREPQGEVYIAGMGGPRPVFRTAKVMEAFREGTLIQVEEPKDAPDVVVPEAATGVEGDGPSGSFLSEGTGDSSPPALTTAPARPIDPKTGKAVK